ncbi:LysR substrate-binding domain-containing protein [Kribbella sp. NPDC051770]|uniref:LysR family transcriptional regulator n=1 Tax=Kribbella sp. NPDC051770 TaxID=3155413 RepID=UPI003426CC8B
MATLRQLEYLVTVVDEGSFTRAAERLHVTQPALSHQIRALERSAGGPLLERLPKNLRLTPAGRAMLPHARAALADADRARQAARQAAGLQAGELQIATLHSITLGILPMALKTWRRLHPAVGIRLHEHPHTTSLTHAMTTGQADIAIGPAPPNWPTAPLVLGIEELVVVVPADDPLAPAHPPAPATAHPTTGPQALTPPTPHSTASPQARPPASPHPATGPQPTPLATAHLAAGPHATPPAAPHPTTGPQAPPPATAHLTAGPHATPPATPQPTERPHPLDRATDVQLSDLADRAWVHYAPHHGLADLLDQACAEAGFHPHIAVRTEQTAAAPALAAAGLGPALVPANILPTSYDGHVLRPTPPICRTLTAYTRGTDPLTTAFLEVLTTTWPNIPGTKPA